MFAVTSIIQQSSCLTFERILEKSKWKRFTTFLGVSDLAGIRIGRQQNIRKTPHFSKRGFSLARVYPYSLSAPEIPTADDDRVHVT